MAEVLQLAQLVELDRVAEVQVGPGRVEAFLDPQRLAAGELRRELGLDQQLVGAALEDGELVLDVDGHGGRCGCVSVDMGDPSAAQGRSHGQYAGGRLQALRATFARIAALPARPPAMTTHKSTILAQSVRATARSEGRAIADGRAVACGRAVRRVRGRARSASSPNTAPEMAPVEMIRLRSAASPQSSVVARRRRPATGARTASAAATPSAACWPGSASTIPRRSQFLRTNAVGAALLPAAARQAAARRDRRRRPARQAALRDRRRRAPVDRPRRRAAHGGIRCGAGGGPLEDGVGEIQTRRCSPRPMRRACPTR